MLSSDVPAELVEKAARAMWNAQTRQPWQQIDDGDEWPSWVDLATRDRLREKVRHALAAVLPEIQAQALEDAADDWRSGLWAAAPRRADRVQERIANGQFVGDWLRQRAARLSATTEEPTT